MTIFQVHTSYIPPEYDIGKDCIEKLKFQRSISRNEVIIFVTVKLTGEDVVVFQNG